MKLPLVEIMDKVINIVFTEDGILIRRIEMNPSEEVLNELGISSHEEYLEYLATLIDELYE